MKILVIHDVDIDELNLSVRAWNCLRRANINTVQDIVDNYDNLKRVRNLAQKAYDEVIEKIKPYTRTVSEDKVKPMSDRERLCDLIKKSHCVETWNYNTDDFKNPNPIETLADFLLENGVIVPPCKFGDTVYVIPSKANIGLNIVNGFAHLNRVYEQKISKIEIFANNKYLLTTCDGLQSVHCDLYKETWFLTREEADQALKEGEGK